MPTTQMLQAIRGATFFHFSSKVESLHSLMGALANKRRTWSDRSYVCAMQVSILHFNANLNREQRSDKDGKLMYAKRMQKQR